jgi:hypothetical protein
MKASKVLTSFVVKMEVHMHILVRMEKSIPFAILQGRGHGEVKVLNA